MSKRYKQKRRARRNRRIKRVTIRYVTTAPTNEISFASISELMRSIEDPQDLSEALLSVACDRLRRRAMEELEKRMRWDFMVALFGEDTVKKALESGE